MDGLRSFLRTCKNQTGEVFERETNKLERLRKYNSRNICLSSPEITILRVVRMKVLVPLTVAFGHYHEGEVPDISSYPWLFLNWLNNPSNTNSTRPPLPTPWSRSVGQFAELIEGWRDFLTLSLSASLPAKGNFPFPSLRDENPIITLSTMLFLLLL